MERDAGERREEARAPVEHEEWERELEREHAQRAEVEEERVLIDAQRGEPAAPLEPLLVHLVAEVVAPGPREAGFAELPEAGEEVDRREERPHDDEGPRVRE